MAQGMGFGDNTVASLITRGLAETARLGAVFGADPMTFAGLAGLGDLVATCSSPLSRNRTFGERLGRGETLEQAQQASRGQVVEGVKSCRSVLELADRYGADVPITRSSGGGLFPRDEPRRHGQRADAAGHQARVASCLRLPGPTRRGPVAIPGHSRRTRRRWHDCHGVTGRRIRVAVVYGGRSSEHGVSVVSAGSVMSALDPEKYDVIPVGITRHGGWVLTEVDPEKLQVTGRTLPEVETGSAVVLPGDPTAGRLVVFEPGAGVRVLDAVDVVFPVLHGRFGEDGTIQGLLEMAGVPYVGPGVLASARSPWTRSSPRSCCVPRGCRVGDYAVLRRGDLVSAIDLTALGMPVFVKPARSGSSVGITNVRQPADLADAVVEALRHDDKVLVEAAVPGREGGMRRAGEATTGDLWPACRRRSGWSEITTGTTSRQNTSTTPASSDVPARLPADVTERVRDLACRAFVALRLRRARPRRLLLSARMEASWSMR